MKPLCIDIFAGLGGWSAGFLAEGYDCVGFDIERHVYGDMHYPAQLVLQDALTIHGKQFKDAACIVCSPPCQFFSYCAMPWTRAKALAAEVRSDPVRLAKELALFNACFRIQREATEAAGRHIPMVVENVRWAIPWVGRSRGNFGSYHLWGDVPALMPPTQTIGTKRPGMNWSGSDKPGYVAKAFNDTSGITGHWTNPAEHVKQGGDWFNASQPSMSRLYSSKSTKRKAASALIAKIPETLSRHIARTYLPR